ncbi:MAG: isoprenylcysteine carboxylmethyltransferase family protein [Prolixibacteraceae bacterium]|jgi:protein-S-isoprenylcysteine O-methyltransferase Ste14
MNTLVIFAILSIPVIIISWRTLFNFKSHGFYRFFSWECIAWLLASNYKFWFENVFSIRQIFSWILLFLGAYLVIAGVILLKKAGKPTTNRKEESLYAFEKTVELVDTGIFSYIRHPLYSSLLFLTWGIFLKNITVMLFFVAVGSSVFLYLTARFDEKECLQYFGAKYLEYMKLTKMFVPFLI